jgi:hypothetical protein
MMYFESKVLCRQHAEVWEETGNVRIRTFEYLVCAERLFQISIKDVKTPTGHSYELESPNHHAP